MSRTRTGPDLLHQDEIRAAVREAYRGIPTGAGRAVAERFYTAGELARVDDETIAWSLGVGCPVRHAGLVEGETVLDLGCGAGIDTVLAAERVGPSGRVVGLDMLPEMRDRARAAAAESGSGAWCELLTGEMEAIPLPDASVGVVISNGVLNLSPRKSRAIAEIARVLEPGGRLCIADLVVDGDLPPEVLASGAAWAGCIAGAVSERVLTGKLERAGFTDITISERKPFSLDDVASYPLFDPEVVEVMRQLIPEEARARVAVGVIVRAVKPTPERSALHTGATARAAPSGTMHLDSLAPDAAEAPGVTVRHVKSVEDVQLKVLDVEPACSTPFHTHPHAHEGIVIAGTGVLRLDGRSEPLWPGSTFTVNPTDPHAIACEAGDEPLRFVCMDCFVE